MCDCRQSEIRINQILLKGNESLGSDERWFTG